MVRRKFEKHAKCVLACRNLSRVGKSCSELEPKMHCEVIPDQNWVIDKNRFLNYSRMFFFYNKYFRN